MRIEKKNEVSLPAENHATKNFYVSNDITTFFTMMVGIYFPSVTGEKAEAHVP